MQLLYVKRNAAAAQLIAGLRLQRVNHAV